MARKIVYLGIVMVVAGLIGSELFCGTSREGLAGNFLYLEILGVFIVVIPSAILFARRQRAGIAGIGVVALAILWVVASFTVGGRGVVASGIAPDGTEMCVIETPGGETYQTGFYYRRPGQRWGWFYYEHEDSHWWLGRIRMNADGTSAIIYRFLLPVAYFDIPAESFTLVRWNRTTRPAQRWMPEGWRPQDAVKAATNGGSPIEVGAPDNNPSKEMDRPDTNGSMP